MNIKQNAKRDEVLSLLNDAEACIAKWDSSELMNDAKDSLALSIDGIREHIADDQASRMEYAAAVYRLVTDSADIAALDASKIILKASSIFGRYI